MKRKGLLVLGASALMLAMATGTAIGTLRGPARGIGDDAEAAAAGTTRTFYLDPSVDTVGNDGISIWHWNTGNAVFAIYWFGNGDGWSGIMQPATGLANCYVTSIDVSNATNVIFVRLKAGTTSPNWDVKDNQSVDLPLSEAKDLWAPTDTVREGAGQGNNTGVWHEVAALSETKIDYYAEVDTSAVSGLGGLHAYVWKNGAYVIGAPSWPGLEMEAVAGENGLYKVSASETYDMIIFNGKIGTTERQTNDLAIPDFAKKIDPTHRVEVKYAISGMEETGKYHLIGAWVFKSESRFSTDTYRIWLDRNGQYEGEGYQYAIHYWKAAANGNPGYDYEMLAVGYLNFGVDGAERYLAYFDVSKDIVKCKMQFKIYESATGNFQAATDDTLGYDTGMNAMLCYMDYDAGQNMFSWSYGIAAKDQAAESLDVNALAKVYEGYFTCRDDLNNGYKTYDVFIKTWLHDDKGGVDTWWIKGNLSDVTISDYASGDTEYTGDKSATYTLQQKHEEMLALYMRTNQAMPAVFNAAISGEAPWAAIVVAAAVVLIGCTGLVGFATVKSRRKKEKR